MKPNGPDERRAEENRRAAMRQSKVKNEKVSLLTTDGPVSAHEARF
jgi:hypothetical protein